MNFRPLTPGGQRDFGTHSKAKHISQFMQTKFLCHKHSQNTPIFSVSYYRNCTFTTLTTSFLCASSIIQNGDIKDNVKKEPIIYAIDMMIEIQQFFEDSMSSREIRDIQRSISNVTCTIVLLLVFQIVTFIILGYHMFFA